MLSAILSGFSMIFVRFCLGSWCQFAWATTRRLHDCYLQLSYRSELDRTWSTATGLDQSYNHDTQTKHIQHTITSSSSSSSSSSPPLSSNFSNWPKQLQESCAIAKMTARCADKSKQIATPPKIMWLSVDSIQPNVMDVGVEWTFSPKNFSMFPWE